MAATDVRPKITLACQECKNRNYITRKNRRNDPDRLELKKYCPRGPQAHGAPRDPLTRVSSRARGREHGAGPGTGRAQLPALRRLRGRPGEDRRVRRRDRRRPTRCTRDAEAARAAGHPDVIAPPTFAIVVSLEAAMVVLDDPDVALDYSRVVHGEQKFTHHRPIRAGDRLVATTTIDAARTVAGNDLLTARVDLATEDGEAVCTATSMLVARGEA